MSASSKKKLRAEENAAKLTEKQIAQNKEDRKTRLYTIGFAVVLVVLIVTAAVVGINRAVANSGSRERKTVAVMMGDETMSNEELGYYFIDTVNSFYSQNASYLSLFGLDTSKALNQQVYNEETGETWADYFMNSAAESARAIYAVCREAAAQGYTLPQENEDQIATAENNIGIYAGLYGYSKPEDYLKAMYGKGASMEGYKNYLRDNMTAQTYQETYQNGLTFTADEVNAKDALDPTYYNSYSFNQYYLSTALYLDDAATNEEKAAAAEKDANSLIGEDIGSVADLDAAIAALAVNADTDAASTAITARQIERKMRFVTSIPPFGSPRRERFGCSHRRRPAWCAGCRCGRPRCGSPPDSPYPRSLPEADPGSKPGRDAAKTGAEARIPCRSAPPARRRRIPCGHRGPSGAYPVEGSRCSVPAPSCAEQPGCGKPSPSWKRA